MNKDIYCSVKAVAIVTMDSTSIHNEVKAYIASSGYTLTQVVKEMNTQRSSEQKTTVQNISNKLVRGTIKYSEVLEIARIIGMKVNWL